MRAGRLAAVPAPLLVIGAMFSVQFGSGIARTVFDQITPMGVAFLRQGLAAVILLVITRPQVRGWTRQQWMATAAYGVALAGMNGSFYAALNQIPLGLAVTLEFMGPLTMSLAMSRRGRDVGWALMAGLGVVLLGWTSHAAGSWMGYALALVAGAFWVGYILITKRIGESFEGLDGLAVALTIAALITAPLGARSAMGAFTDANLFVRSLLVALLCSIVVYVLEMAALRRMPPRVFGILLSLEPAVAALAGLVVLGQLLGAGEIVGLVLVCTASAAVAWETRSMDGGVQPQD